MAFECYVFKQVFRVHYNNTLAKQLQVVATTLALLILLITKIQTVSYCNHLIDLALHPFIACRLLSL